MKYSLLLISFAISFTCASAQRIDISKHLGGIRYYIEGREIPPREAYRRMTMNPEASALYGSVTFKKTAASVMVFSGAVFTGFNIARAISPPPVRKKISGTFMAAGIGLIALSVPLHASYRRKAEKAVNLYNEGLPYSSGARSPILINMSLNEKGLGLVIRF